MAELEAPSDGYATAQEVIDYLGIDIEIGENTDPTIGFVDKFINYSMAEMERICKKAWRTKRFTQLIKDIPTAWSTNRGTPLYLAHTDVKPLDSAEGDKIEAWDGGKYVDVLANNSLVFYELERIGKLWIRGYLWSWVRDDRLRITYRYGSELTDDVREACIKLTCIKLIERSFKFKMLAFGGNINPTDILENWKKEMDEFYADNQEWILIEH